jgi:anaerobic selenocysteine-containing dehydrogenase
MPAQPEHFQEIGWEDALNDIASRLIQFGQGYGPSARACLLDGCVPLEDCYVAAKLFKGVLGSNAIDSVESLHSRATEVAYMEQLGAIGPPGCYDDLRLANLIVVVGEDLASTHPVLYAKVVEAVVTRGADLVVIDPRTTATALRAGAVHLPARAGSEVALFNSLAYVIIHDLQGVPEDWTSQNVLNSAAFTEFAKVYNPSYDKNERVDSDHVADLCDTDPGWVRELGNRDAVGNLKSFDVGTITGLTEEAIRDLAGRWDRASSVITIWSSRLAGAGDGGDAIASILNLHLLTGQIGRPGAGPMGIPATASGRGAYDTGATPLGLPGGARGIDETPPDALVVAWGDSAAQEAARLPPGPGPINILKKAGQGEVPMLVLLGGAVTPHLPDQDGLVEPAMREARFVVSSAAHMEDPDVMWADLVLPSLPWYERELHLTSAERKVARSLPSLGAPGGPRTELEMLSEMGSMMVADDLFPFVGSTGALEELARATKGTPADMTALPLGDELTEARGVQWPVSTERAASLKGNPRRHMGQDGGPEAFPTPSGKAVILPQEHKGLMDPPGLDYPMLAIVSIGPDTWWSGQHYPPEGGAVVRSRQNASAYVELAAEDAQGMGLAEGDLVKVTTPRGSIIATARIAEEGTLPGYVFVPWGGSVRTSSMPPSFPLDRHSVPPWSVFACRVEPALGEE